MLAYRDGAELVATVSAFGLGARAPYDGLVAALAAGGLDDRLVRVAARTLLHFVLGHVGDEQTHLQAGSVGAIADDSDEPRDGSDFAVGLSIVVDGIRRGAEPGLDEPGSTCSAAELGEQHRGGQVDPGALQGGGEQVDAVQRRPAQVGPGRAPPRAR